MKLRLLCAVLALAAMALLAGGAGATVVPRITGVESATSPYGFDQVSASGCTGSTTERTTEQSYAGSASLHVRFQRNTGCSPFARGIFEANGGNHLVSGDDFWVGAAIYLPRGFWEAHGEYSDLIRIDSYVTDEGRSTSEAERQYIAFAAFSDDRLYMRAVADRTLVINELVAGLPSSEMPEGQWNWVEMHIRLNQTNGSATNELKINGVSKGTSTLANEFSGKAAYNRVRYGLVSSGANGDNIDLYVDRATIERTELGLVRGYESTVLGTSGLISYWRLGEASGTTAADEQTLNNGTYVNSPTLGATGLLTNEADTAAGFDGTNDHVTVAANSTLNPTSGTSLEAWVRPTALQGTVMRRNNSYELRVQSDGSLLFRVWVGGSVQSLESAAREVVTGTTYHLVGTYDGANLRIYKNGRQVASRAQTGSMTHGTNTLYIGFNDFSSSYFSGRIDEVAIYSRGLAAEEAAAHYTTGTS